MLRRAGEAVSLYSGSFQDRPVLSFMYESFKERLETQDTMDSQSQAPAPLQLRSNSVAPLCACTSRYIDGGRAATARLTATEATS